MVSCSRSTSIIHTIFYLLNDIVGSKYNADLLTSIIFCIRSDGPLPFLSIVISQ